MKRVMRLVTFVFLAPGIGLAAESSSGYLVDSKCYEVTQRQAGATFTVERDMQLAIRQCAPTSSTKYFGVVENDWEMVKLDSDGNEKVGELLQQNLKQNVYRVTATGEGDRNTLKVDSISMEQ